MSAATRIRTRSARCVLALVVGPFLLLVACSDGGREPSKYAGAHAGLCSAASTIRTGSALDARATFFNRAHGDLHVLAAELAEKDRAIAARLLTQKQAVEAGPWVDADARQAERLLALARTTRSSIVVLGQAAPKGCTS